MARLYPSRSNSVVANKHSLMLSERTTCLRVVTHSLFRQKYRKSLEMAVTPCSGTNWGLAGWGAPLWERPWGPSRLRTQHKPATCPGSKGGQQYPGLWEQKHSQETGPHDYAHLLCTYESASMKTTSSFGPPNTTKTSINWSRSRGGHQHGWDLEHLPWEEGLRELGLSTLGKRWLWGLRVACRYLQVIKKIEPGSSHWYNMVGARETKAIHWNKA